MEGLSMLFEGSPVDPHRRSDDIPPLANSVLLRATHHEDDHNPLSSSGVTEDEEEPSSSTQQHDDDEDLPAPAVIVNAGLEMMAAARSGSNSESSSVRNPSLEATLAIFNDALRRAQTSNSSSTASVVPPMAFASSTENSGEVWPAIAAQVRRESLAFAPLSTDESQPSTARPPLLSRRVTVKVLSDDDLSPQPTNGHSNGNSPGVGRPTGSSRRSSVASQASPVVSRQHSSEGSSRDGLVTQDAPSSSLATAPSLPPPSTAAAPPPPQPQEAPSCFESLRKRGLQRMGQVMVTPEGDEKLEKALNSRPNLEMAPDGLFARIFDVIVCIVLMWAYVDFTMSIHSQTFVNSTFRIVLRILTSVGFIIDWWLQKIFAPSRFSWPRQVLEGIAAIPLECLLLVVPGWRDSYALNLAFCTLRMAKFTRWIHIFESSHPERIDGAYVTFFYQIVPTLRTAYRLLGLLHTLAWVKMWISVGSAAQYWPSLFFVWTVFMGSDQTLDLQEEYFVAQSILFSILVFLAVVMNGFIISYISLIVFTFSVDEQHRQQMVATRELTKHYRLPVALQHEVLSIQHNILENAGTTQAYGSVLETLPPALLRHVARYVKIDVLSRFALFRDINDTDVIHNLAEALTRETFTPETDIVTAGDVGDCMYFMDHGFAEVVLPNGLVVATLRRGDYFGEIALLSEDSKRKATIRALTYCQAFSLSKDDFMEALNQSQALVDAVLEKRRALGIQGPLRSDVCLQESLVRSTSNPLDLPAPSSPRPSNAPGAKRDSTFLDGVTEVDAASSIGGPEPSASMDPAIRSSAGIKQPPPHTTTSPSTNTSALHNETARLEALLAALNNNLRRDNNVHDLLGLAGGRTTSNVGITRRSRRTAAVDFANNL